MPVTDPAYTRRYFSDGARRWLATAYVNGAEPASYPLGPHRVRLALTAAVEHLGAARGRLVDVGCGGGDLCFGAAELGFDAIGVDIAEGMIAEARRRAEALAPDVRARVDFRVGEALALGDDGEPLDAITALGLVEYLETDAPFFAWAARRLRRGGVLVVSCRNRLFNIASLNDYTRRECERGGAPALLDELAALGVGRDVPELLDEFVHRLREALPELTAALAQDRAAGAAPHDTSASFHGERRQHTPHEIEAVARAAGLQPAGITGLHPHPWPPAWERVAPRFYNRLAAVYEALEAAPASLVRSSSFVAAFTR